MNQMEEALYRVGAHIVFKQPAPRLDAPLPLNKWKIPIPTTTKNRRKTSSQRIINCIPLDPINKQSAIVTSKARPEHLPPQ